MKMAIDVYGYGPLIAGVITAFLLAITLALVIVCIRRQYAIARAAGALPLMTDQTVASVEEAGCTPVKALKVFSVITAVGSTAVFITLVAFDYLHVAIGIVLLALMWMIIWFVLIPPADVGFQPLGNSPASLSVSATCTRFAVDSRNKVKTRPVLIFVGLAVIAACSFVLLYALAGLCLDLYTGTPLLCR